MFKPIMRTTGLIVAAGTITLATTGCGITKIEQCTSMGQTIKDLKTVTDQLGKEIEATEPGTKEGIKIMSTMATKYHESSKAMQSLDIQDEKLKGFQSSLATKYEDYSSLLDQMSSATKSKNVQLFDKVASQVDSTVAKEKTLGKELAEYCLVK
jgi:predicted RNase H-like nuclease (RuvC/YqgF family)